MSSFTSDQGLITDLIGFLDHSTTILRAKALVALCILYFVLPFTLVVSIDLKGTLSRLSHRCLLWACSFKILPALERIEKEKEQEQKDSYLKQCCQAFTNEIMNVVKNVTNQVALDLRTILAGIGAQDSRSTTFKKILASPTLKALKERIPVYHLLACDCFFDAMSLTSTDASYFAIVLHVVASVVYRHRAFTASTITDLAESLTHAGHLLSLLEPDPVPVPATDPDSVAIAALVVELEEFHHNLVIVLEGLSQNATVLVDQVIRSPLPNVIHAPCTNPSAARRGDLPPAAGPAGATGS